MPLLALTIGKQNGSRTKW